MNNNDPLTLDALRRANKLGAKGIEVVGYIISDSAASDGKINLITRQPYPQSALDKSWYEE